MILGTWLRGSVFAVTLALLPVAGPASAQPAAADAEENLDVAVVRLDDRPLFRVPGVSAHTQRVQCHHTVKTAGPGSGSISQGGAAGSGG